MMKRRMAVLVLLCAWLGMMGGAMAAEMAGPKEWVAYVFLSPLKTLEDIDTGGQDVDAAEVVIAGNEAGGHYLRLPEGMVAADAMDRVVRYALTDEDAQRPWDEVQRTLLVPETFEVIGRMMTAQEVTRDGNVLHCVRYDDWGKVIDEQTLTLTEDTLLYFDESLEGVYTAEDIVFGQQYDLMYDEETFVVYKMSATNG